jgi:hypothetical protein
VSTETIVRALALRTAEWLGYRVIRDLQRITDHLSGQDGPLKNIWDEICVQLQWEHSVVWEEVYEPTVRALVEAAVEELSAEEREALWLQTDDGIEWEPSNWKDMAPVDDSAISDWLISEQIYPCANSWSNARIRRFLENAMRRDDLEID